MDLRSGYLGIPNSIDISFKHWCEIAVIKLYILRISKSIPTYSLARWRVFKVTFLQSFLNPTGIDLGVRLWVQAVVDEVGGSELALRHELACLFVKSQ
jgi:hypothetical protein